MAGDSTLQANRPPDVKEVHILWTPDGMSCDGDTISVTAATQPSIEDVIMGAIPGLPKVHLHNRVLDLRKAAKSSWKSGTRRRRASSRPFVLVVEGSIPNEEIKSEGYWAAMGNEQQQPASRSRFVNGSTGWLLRRGPWLQRARAPPTAAFMRWRAIPPACMGLADYLGWDWRSKAGLPIVNVPGCPVQPDNMMETLLYLLYQAAGLGADDPAGRATCGRRGSSAKPCTKVATAPAITNRAISPTSTARPSAWSRSAAGDLW